MQITFVSNYINHHQIPLSDSLYKLSGGSYTFIQTERMEQERISMGWDEDGAKKPYVKLFFEDEEGCKNLLMESDCVIFGGTPMQELIIPRLEAGLFTIRYDERIYKDGRWKFISPRGLKQKYHDHIRFRKSNVYMLCAGAYVKGDFELIHAYPGKMLKFGYFPKFIEYPSLHEKRIDNVKTEILWAARLIDWKHPEIMVALAEKIKAKNINAHITMVGNGELLDYYMRQTSNLADYISWKGAVPADDVRKAMRNADIFISTSDRKEGWGAVVNEAMNSGCATIAAKEIGAAPYLLESGVNGFTYKACDVDELFRIVEKLSVDSTLAYKIGQAAYDTIRTTWNAEAAADRLYDFIINSGNVELPKEGPLSPA